MQVFILGDCEEFGKYFINNHSSECIQKMMFVDIFLKPQYKFFMHLMIDSKTTSKILFLKPLF